MTADGEDRSSVRRRAIAAMLVRLGFISSATAAQDNSAVDILAELLPDGSEVGLCLSYHEYTSSATYRFRERSGVFRRPTTPRPVGPFAYGSQFVPMPRTEIVLCTRDELLWTGSRPRIEGSLVVEGQVTLYAVPFSDVLGAAVHDRRHGDVEVWIDAGPTLTFRTTPGEVESLCSYVDQAATSQ